MLDLIEEHSGFVVTGNVRGVRLSFILVSAVMSSCDDCIDVGATPTAPRNTPVVLQRTAAGTV